MTMTETPDGSFRPEASPPPDRTDLAARLNRANRLGLLFLAGESALLLYLVLAVLDWSAIKAHPLLSLTAAGIAVAASLAEYVKIIFQNKKKVEDLENLAVLGRYSKSRLLELVHNLTGRAGVDPGSVNVFVVREKEVNAGAIKAALVPFFPSFGGVFLNRSVLHLMAPEELEFLLGHELGHAHGRTLLWDKYRPLHLTLAALLALLIIQVTGWNDHLGLIATVVVMAAVHQIISLPGGILAQDLEFACDDYGAALSSPEAAVNALLKIGAEGEARLDLFEYAMTLRRSSSDLSLKDVTELYEEALPFDPADPEYVESLMRSLAAGKASAKKGISLKGYLEYISDGPAQEDQEEAIEAELFKLEMLKQEPALDWRGEFLRPGASKLGTAEIDQLVRRLESEPDLLLFRRPGDADDRGQTHPSIRRRILYIWKNREALGTGR